MKKDYLRSFLESLNYFDPKFLDYIFEDVLTNISLCDDKNVILVLEMICSKYYDYLRKSNASLNLEYLKALTLSVIRIYKTENSGINSYDKSILENINNLSEDKLCSIIISIEACSFFMNNGIFIIPEYYDYDVNKVKESLVSKLSK